MSCFSWNLHHLNVCFSYIKFFLKVFDKYMHWNNPTCFMISLVRTYTNLELRMGSIVKFWPLLRKLWHLMAKGQVDAKGADFKWVWRRRCKSRLDILWDFANNPLEAIYSLEALPAAASYEALQDIVYIRLPTGINFGISSKGSEITRWDILILLFTHSVEILHKIESEASHIMLPTWHISYEFVSIKKNSRIRETKHLSTDADSSTDAIGGWTKAKSAKKKLFFARRF